MSAQEILQILQNFNVETLILAGVTYLLTSVIKKIIPYKNKKVVHIIPFVIGIVLYFCYAFFLLNLKDYIFIIKKGVTVGGLATFLYAIIKQLSKSGTLKTTVADILKGILKSSSVNTVASQIISNYSSKNSNQQNYDAVSSIIAKNTSISQNECSVITDIILKEMDGKTK